MPQRVQMVDSRINSLVIVRSDIGDIRILPDVIVKKDGRHRGSLKLLHPFVVEREAYKKGTAEPVL